MMCEENEKQNNKNDVQEIAWKSVDLGLCALTAKSPGSSPSQSEYLQAILAWPKKN